MPTRADGTLLPAILALLLALLAAFQLVAGDDDPLPESYGRVVMPVVQARPMTMVAVDPAIARASIFTPVRNEAHAGGQASLGPLGDATPVGVVRDRRVTRVILQCADGRVLTLPLGGAYHGWRVAAVASDGVRFVGEGGSVVIPLAVRALSTAPSGAPRSDTR